MPSGFKKQKLTAVGFCYFIYLTVLYKIWRACKIALFHTTRDTSTDKQLSSSS
jgi:hypothetical protein